MTTQPKILVTGGAGFIGSYVVDLFCQQGWAVVVVDNLSTGQRTNLNPAATLYEVDIREAAALAAVFERERPQYVSHHAAQVNVRYSLAHPTEDAHINILGTLNVLDCARQVQVRHLVYISSCAIYGEPQYLPCDEQHPTAVQNPYGLSKLTVEQYLPLYARDAGLAYTVLRYANVYGPRQNVQGEAGVVAIFANQMVVGGALGINGNGEQQRDFLYVTDCARANWLALTQHKTGTYNLGSGVGTSINTLFNSLRELTGYAQAPVQRPAIPGEVLNMYLNADRAGAVLGWEPRVSLAEGLQATVDYFRGLQGGVA